MPQLDFSTYPSQIFWLLIFFWLFYWFISAVFLPKIQIIVKKRDDLIKQSEAEALQMEQEIQYLISKYQRAVDDAKFAAQNIVDETYSLAQNLKKEALSSFAEKEKNLYAQNKKELTRFIADNKDILKRIVFDLTLQYYSCLFSASLKEKVIDFSQIKIIVSRDVDKFCSGNIPICL